VSSAARIGFGSLIVLGALVAAVVFWPTRPLTGPEPIAWGRDACARCRMLISQPGYAGELRDRQGQLHKYDDVGCLVAAVVGAHVEVPEAWVEDHAGGGFVPLLAARFVRTPDASTPMGHGVLAFREEAAARAFAQAGAGRAIVSFEDLLRDRAWLEQRRGGSS
jgi:copper chaperone NosL